MEGWLWPQSISRWRAAVGEWFLEWFLVRHDERDNTQPPILREWS
jgi:hypothetical protein